jgi:hypothetical protein
MDKEQLHQLLGQLHAELGRTQAVDAGDRELLKSLQADVQAILERADESAEIQYGPLGARLRHGVQRFEVSHPQLTWAMSEVLEILSRSGV